MIYKEQFERAIGGLKKIINLIKEKMFIVKDIYLCSFLQFYNMDLWTLAHIWRVMYISHNWAECRVCNYLVDTACQNNMWRSFNTDILQNIAYVKLNCTDIPQKGNSILGTIIDEIKNRQNNNGSWGYQKNEEDVTLTSYVIRVLDMYGEGREK